MLMNDPIVKKVAEEGLFGQDVSKIDTTKPFVDAKHKNERKKSPLSLSNEEMQEYLNIKIGEAVAVQHLDEVKQLIERGADIDGECIDSDNNCWGLLEYAAVWGDLELAELLIENGADISIPNVGNTDLTPLHSAIVNDKEDVALYLIDKGANVDATMLAAAAAKDNTNIMLALINKGIDVNALALDLNSRPSKKTALMAASFAGKIDAVKFLIEHKADVNAIDSDELTAFYHAFAAGKHAVAIFLKEHGASISGMQYKMDSWLLEVISREEDVTVIADIIKCGADANAKSSIDGMTLLGVLTKSSNKNCVEVAKVLIAAKADVNTPDRNGMTPLMNACHFGEVKLAELLVDSGADVTAKSNTGRTAFDIVNVRDYDDENKIRIMLYNVLESRGAKGPGLNLI